MLIRTIDIGGSGVKSAQFALDNNSPSGLRLEGDIRHFENPDWAHFEEWIKELGIIDTQIVGIACAGFVDALEGVVRLFRVGGWRDKDLKLDLGDRFKGVEFHILNDAEAHLMAHAHLYPHPMMNLCLGTSPGFAMSRGTGMERSPRSGVILNPRVGRNFDIGAVRIPTSASNNEVWWALGAEGLKELQGAHGRAEGTKHFGSRLGSFLVSICSIFQPKTVVLSGGIVDAHWSYLERRVHEEFGHGRPDWLEQPEIVKSPYAKDAALWGMARCLYSTRMESPRQNWRFELAMEAEGSEKLVGRFYQLHGEAGEIQQYIFPDYIRGEEVLERLYRENKITRQEKRALLRDMRNSRLDIGSL